MLRVILAVAGALVVSALHMTPAQAQAEAQVQKTPWCAVISEGHWDCQYRSIEECRPNVLAGNRGWCNPNPYFVAQDRPADYQRHRKGAVHPLPGSR